MEDLKVQLVKILNRIGALKFGTFKLTSGNMSPYYIDMRIIPSFSDEFKQICDMYIRLIKTYIGENGYDRIAGIPTAGISFGTIVAYHFNKPFLYVRSSERRHGKKKRIEGIMMNGELILLIDDLITKGGSILNTAETIRAEGGLVTDAIVLLDREENGEKNLAETNIKLHPILKISELAHMLYAIKSITKEQLNKILMNINSQ